MLVNSATGQPFVASDLTDLINRMAYQPRPISALISPQTRGATTADLSIDTLTKRIGIVDPTPRGGVPSRTLIEDGAQIKVTAPYYSDLAVVRAAECTGRRVVGSVNAFETTEARLQDVLMQQRGKFENAWELSLVGAIFAQLRNSKGQVVLDYGAKFGVAPSQSAFDFNDDAANFIKFLGERKRSRQEKTSGVLVTGWMLLVPDQMWSAVRFHPSMVKAFDRYQEGAYNRTSGRLQGMSVDDNIEIINVGNWDLGGGNFLFPVDQIALVPRADSLFQRRFAPAERGGFANTPGLPLYVTPEALPFYEGEQLLLESTVATYNQLPETVDLIEQV